MSRAVQDAHSAADVDQSRISIHLPRNLLILPPTAAFVGLVIGMSRGGSRARLRFLAENAHRPPTTIQGWYFYTKTRNYRVFYAAATTGARYALGLGGAVAAYCILDDSAGWLREQLGWAADTHQVVRDTSVPVHDHRRRLSEIRDVEGDRWSGWRQGPVHWEDGAFAGLLMGAGVGFAYALPRPLFIRSLIMGTLLGGSTSALQVAQAKVGRLRDEQAREEAAALPLIDATASDVSVDRPVKSSLPLHTVPVDESMPTAETIDALAPTPDSATGSGASWFSWLPGRRR